MSTAEDAAKAAKLCFETTQADLTTAIPTSVEIKPEGIPISGHLLRDNASNVFRIELDEGTKELIANRKFEGGSRKPRKKGGRKRKFTGGKSKRNKKRS